MPKARRRVSAASSITVYQNKSLRQTPLLIGTPTLGTVRIEWVQSRMGMVIPTSWSHAEALPIGYLVDDAQNLIAKQAIEGGFEWLWFIEDDVLVPLMAGLLIREYMSLKPHKRIPVMGGLYHLKGVKPPEPLIYRGHGVGPFRDFKMGDKVWVDGIHTGCTLIHVPLLRELAKTAETYTLSSQQGSVELKRIFEAPTKVLVDPALGSFRKVAGTSDLYFCTQVYEKGLHKAYPAVAKREHWVLCDSRLSCGHIDRETGVVW